MYATPLIGPMIDEPTRKKSIFYTKIVLGLLRCIFWEKDIEWGLIGIEFKLYSGVCSRISELGGKCQKLEGAYLKLELG